MSSACSVGRLVSSLLRGTTEKRQGKTFCLVVLVTPFFLMAKAPRPQVEMIDFVLTLIKTRVWTRMEIIERNLTGESTDQLYSVRVYLKDSYEITALKPLRTNDKNHWYRAHMPLARWPSLQQDCVPTDGFFTPGPSRLDRMLESVCLSFFFVDIKCARENNERHSVLWLQAPRRTRCCR